MSEGSVSHLAGVATEYENRLRQRCQWCGYVIIDDDLSLIAYQICDLPIGSGSCQRSPRHSGECSFESDFKVPEWPQGKFVRISDMTNPKMYEALEPEPSEIEGRFKVPDDACLRLPPELTLSVEADFL